MPNNLGPEIWVANGQYHETKDNPAKALDNYTKALELEPTNEAALLSTARLYAKQEQNQQAVEFFNKAIAVNPAPSTYNDLFQVNQKLGKTADAQAAIQRAIELEPSNPRYRNNLASLQVAGGRSDEAVKTLEKVFSPAVANYNVAYLHFNNSNIAGAQQHLQIALQNDPNLQPARELAEKLGGSQAAQSAMATYNAAGQIYRTAQTLSTPATSAAQVPYQQPATGIPAPTQPVSGYPAPAYSAPAMQTPTQSLSTPPAATQPAFAYPAYPVQAPSGVSTGGTSLNHALGLSLACGG